MNTAPKPRVLYLTHRIPYPPDKGDRIRNYHVLRELVKHSRVWLAALADEPVAPAHTEVLQSLCERVAVVPVSRRRWWRAGVSLVAGGSLSEGLFREPRLDDTLAGWANETAFDATVVSASSLTQYQRRHGFDRCPAFVDLVDVDSQKWFDYAARTTPPKRWVYRVEGRRVRELERRIAGWAAGVMLVSEAEAALYNSFTAAGTATAATNGVDLDYFHPQPNMPTEPACAFVGALDYFPNVDAAVWFATQVWPRVREVHPAAEFRVVGRKPVPAVLRLNRIPGVTVVGGVPDVRPHVAAAAVAVCPVLVARGLQNKVLEAMAMGKATVAAPPAVVALRATVGRDLLSPGTPDEWVAALTTLLADPHRRTELGANARRYVETHHHWDRCLRPFIERMVPGVASKRSSGSARTAG